MTEIFRIIGKNDIHFDAGPTGNYFFTQGEPPRKLTTVLTRREVLLMLSEIPLGIRPMALKHGLSIITMELNIQGSDDADMEAKEHALIETLVETDVFFSNGGTMGTKGELQIKSDGASEASFKSVFYGVVDELDSRDVLGAVIKAHRLEGLRLTLYCEPYWRPGTFNHLFNGGFEHWDRVIYGGTGADTEPDGWLDYEHAAITGTNNREAVEIQQGTYSLEIDVTASGGGGQYKGVTQDIFLRVIPGVTYTLIAWLRNDAVAIGDCRIEIEVVGDVSGISSAYSGTAVHAAYTRYTTAFTPIAADTTMIVRAYILSSAPGADGTIYIDGMMVVRGTVIPDDFIEWHPNPGIRIGPDLLSNAGFELWTSPFVDNQPDCWADDEWQAGNLTGEVNNRESIEVIQGCYALEIIITGSTGAGAKGVQQDIRARVTNDVEYVLIGWIKNDAITVGRVRFGLYKQVGGDIWGGYDSGNANDEYTRYAFAFTPVVGDLNVRIKCQLYAPGAGASGTVYFDKIEVIEASVLNGHSFAPEEWTGCGYIYNHLDKACDGAGACHVNYLDIDENLRGDVDGRPRIEMESLFSNSYGTGELTVARRTDPCLPCQFYHFLDASIATTQDDWADHVDTARSECEVVSNSAADLDGHVIWDLGTLGYTFACQKGRFRVLGAVYADYDGVADENIKFKAEVGIGAAYQESAWLQPLIADTWHWLDFGVFEVTGQFWGDELPLTLYWRVDYLKEASDLVEFDFLLLLPEDESMLRIQLGEYYLATKDYTAATIAFAATTPGTITDTAAGLAIFLTGDKIQVTGSASNDGFYTVSTGGVAGTIRTIEPTVLEALGATITIASYEDVLWDNTFDFTLAVKRSYQDTFAWHPPVQAEPLALKPEEQNRLIFAIGHYVSAAFPYKGCWVHEDDDEHMLVSLKYLPQFVSPLE